MNLTLFRLLRVLIINMEIYIKIDKTEVFLKNFQKSVKNTQNVEKMCMITLNHGIMCLLNEFLEGNGYENDIYGFNFLRRSKILKGD